MTKEEAGKLYTTGILLSKPGEGIDCSIKIFRELIFNAFINGVEWSEKQGVIYNDTVYMYNDDEGNLKRSHLSLTNEGELEALEKGNFEPGDDVTIQIKKKNLSN